MLTCDLVVLICLRSTASVSTHVPQRSRHFPYRTKVISKETPTCESQENITVMFWWEISVRGASAIIFCIRDVISPAEGGDPPAELRVAVRAARVTADKQLHRVIPVSAGPVSLTGTRQGRVQLQHVKVRQACRET